MCIGVSVYAQDRAGLLRDVAAVVAARNANIESIHLTGTGQVELHMDIEGIDDSSRLKEELLAVGSIQRVEIAESVANVFGGRVIVVGGGAQVAQVVLGAVSEADRHNLRGQRISVDTIPLVGEAKLAEAVRTVARLPRAKILVLAGSLMGGDITAAVHELREKGIPVISLNMAGSVPDAADLVVSDPVQAGVMAVMAIVETAQFNIARVRGKRL